MSEQQNKDIVIEMWREVKSRGVDALLDYLAPDYIRHDAERDYSREEFVGILRERYVAFPDLVSDVSDVLAEGDRVAYRWASQGTHRGAYLGIPPTNRAVQAEGVTISRFENGKIVEDWASWNKNSVLHSLGILPVLNPDDSAT